MRYRFSKPTPAVGFHDWENLAGPTLASENARAYHSLGSGIDEDVRGKFEAGTEFANLTQSELALTGKKHGDGTFRTELRN